MFLNLGSMGGTTDTALNKPSDEFSKVLNSTSTANAYIQVMDYLDNENFQGTLPKEQLKDCITGSSNQLPEQKI